MSKLFSLEEQQIEDEENDIEVSLDELIEDGNDSLNIALEAFNTSLTNLKIITNMRSNIENKEKGSLLYFNTIENYQPVLESISSNLGYKFKVPSLEDFKNPYGLKASHSIAMEGFYDFIKKVWEHIKDFFKTFWKKVMLFFKRLVNADLDLEEYEKYVEKMISKIRHSDSKLKDNSKMESKLPGLLTDENVTNFDFNTLISTGLKKIENLAEVKNKLLTLNKESNKALKSMTSGLKSNFEFNKDLKQMVQNKTLNADTFSKMKNALELKDGKLSIVPETFFGNSFFTVVECRNLPDSISDKISNMNFDSTEDIKYLAMINPRNIYDSLPKNLNVFTFKITEKISDTLSIYKYNVFAHSETNKSVENRLEPISNVNNIEQLYKVYKDLSKITNKDIEKILEDLGDSSTELMDFCKNELSNTMENLRDIKSNIEYNSKKDSKDIDELNIKAINELLEIINGYHTSLSHFSNIIFIMIKDISTNICTTSTEVRFSLIKYLYDSCKRYS